MADNGKVRLVRCPKCENLLPELPEYSIYQCGGCGTVLRANIQLAAAVQSLQEEKVQNVSEKLGMFESDDASEAKGNPNDGFLMQNGNVTEQNGKGYPPKNVVTESGGGRGGSDTNGIVHKNGHDLDLFEKQTDGQNGDGFSSRVEQVMEKINAPNPNMRFSFSKYPDDEGPSSSSHLCNREVLFQKLDTMVRDTRVQCLENDRAELLRKLDELKDQLSRSSCNMGAAAEPKEKVPPPVIRRTLSSDTYGGGPSTWCPPMSSSTRASTQLFGHDQNGHYLNQCPEMLLYNDRQDIPRVSYPSSMHNPSSILPPPYHLPPSHHYYSGHGKFMNSSDAFEPALQQSSCGCFHCYNKHRELFPSSAFCKKENNRVLYHQSASSFGSRDLHHDSLSVFHPFSSKEHPHRYNSRWSDLNSCERAADFLQLAFRKTSLPTRGHRYHRPIAGGAPILACPNCVELLQLPKKVMRLPGNQQKLRCGACSNIIYFSVVDRKIIFPVLVGVSDRLNRATVNFSSDDFDNSGYEFHATTTMDRKSVKPSASRTLSLTNSRETESLPTSSPRISHDEINSPEDGFGAAPTREAAASPPPPPASLLQQHLDYSTSSNTHRFGKGNISSRSDKENVVIVSKTTTALRQNSLNEASLATELEVSYNDYSNNDNGGSQDSSRDDEQARLQSQRGGESFLTNFIKKSFKDLSRNNQSAGNGRKTVVSVNGYPLSARLVKKAEKLAGKIQPGNYWYDSRAGFWGIMGGPCLGIIPPYIEEFNYPMPEKCGGGDSGVFVNGRELHKQDLELLAARGLPTDRDRSYIIEISGRVLDEDTGEELDCLGRLAPTVEKVKHGFGMKTPRGFA